MRGDWALGRRAGFGFGYGIEAEVVTLWILTETT